MEQDFIDKLSLEALERYRTSTKLVGITSYTKTNIDGNVEYIEEEINASQKDEPRTAKLEIHYVP